MSEKTELQPTLNRNYAAYVGFFVPVLSAHTDFPAVPPSVAGELTPTDGTNRKISK